MISKVAPSFVHNQLALTDQPCKMLSILRKARLKDKEMRILMLYIPSPSGVRVLANK